jgi:hypothetical protein
MEKEGFRRSYLLHFVEKGDRAAGGVDEDRRKSKAYPS